MYSVLTSNSVACLLLHLTCAMNYSTLPWWACGSESGPGGGGGGGPPEREADVLQNMCQAMFES